MEQIKDLKLLDDWYHSLSNSEKLIASYILAEEDVDYIRNNMSEDEILYSCGFENIEDAINEWNSDKISPREKLNIYLLYNGIDFDEDSMSEYVDLSNIQNYIFLSNKELADKLDIAHNQRPFIKREWLLDKIKGKLSI